ncbi:Kelch repeat-containing protein [Jiulongibacter sediminis]|uniref:Galactose oxidase n=1 Tax=Jiulongibacter sediminis TaxID=1605367 RepID=A0A0P7C4F6_9BACT|nr:kelch repeat-containing protein [Jiulongibacter sediminis]KPM49218.1 galactose oxidase [Jiulongibacter sediminis]TBX26273.1 galactose oxidase [Jiulongibacter sediminis]
MKFVRFLTLFISFSFFTRVQAQQWETLDLSTSCTKRHEASLVSVGDKVFLLGGRGIKPVEILDTKTQTWTKGADTPIEFHHFQAVAYDNEIYVAAAFTGTQLFPHETPIEHMYIYNVDSDTWREGPSLPKDRLRGAAGCVVYDDKLYFVGGALDGHWDGHVTWVDVFNPETQSWQKLADAPNARDHVSIGVIDGKIYVAGGRRTSGKIGKFLDLTEAVVDVYDIANNSWETLPASSNIPTQRAGASAVVMDQQLLIIGGESGVQKQAHNEVEAFDPETGQWKKLSSLNRGRHGTGAALINGKIYTAAGCGNSGGTPELDSVEVYE